MVCGDTGRYPLYIESMINSLRYWLKVRKMPMTRFPKQTLTMLENDLVKCTSTSTSNWAGNIKHCQESYGFQDVWTDGVVNEASFLSLFLKKSITFLDIKLSLKQGKLTTTVHYKSTDSHSYLDCRSSHNLSTKNSIPFSQFLRLRHLYSDDADFEEKAEEMSNFFLQRRYPENTVKKALHQVRPIPRQKKLQPNRPPKRYRL